MQHINLFGMLLKLISIVQSHLMVVTCNIQQRVRASHQIFENLETACMTSGRSAFFRYTATFKACRGIQRPHSPSHADLHVNWKTSHEHRVSKELVKSLMKAPRPLFLTHLRLGFPEDELGVTCVCETGRHAMVVTPRVVCDEGILLWVSGDPCVR